MPCPCLRGSGTLVLREYKEAIRRHFLLAPEERHRRRPPYNHDVIVQDPTLREALHIIFADKCAYCESKLGRLEGEISQLRPPSNAASSHKEKDSPDHYAWLAYEWRNMLLLCQQCERMKGNLFPVEGPRALPQTTWKEAVAAEEALLLDPCVDEPRRHLGYTGNGLVYPVSKRGLATIEVLGLNRSELQKGRANVFGTLVSLPMDFSHNDAIAFLDARQPHAGALRIFVDWPVPRSIAATANCAAGQRPRFGNFACWGARFAFPKRVDARYRHGGRHEGVE